MQIPKLEDYDISPLTGFIPREFPLERLPDPYYEPWETVAANLPSLILNQSIRSIIDTKLPVLETSRLQSEREYQRAYSVLAFLTHAYVWSYNSGPARVLPRQLAKPFKEVSKHLDLPPVATYAGLVLWNFKPALKMLNDNDKDFDVSKLSADNFATICTFTGSIDESWFYLVSCLFEIKGAECLNFGLNALKAAAVDNDPLGVIKNLQIFAELIDALGTLLLRMEEMCDPHVFYFRLRPFLAGWKNMKEFGLDGLVYDDGEEGCLDNIVSYSGGSNAQSSLIQYFDTLLNVVHHPTGHRPQKITNTISNSSKSSLLPTKSTIHSSENNFMQEMKMYMPKRHRDFLSDLAEVSILKEYVQNNTQECPELTLAYDACLAMLKAFRDKHIQIVTRYIIIPSKSDKGSGHTLRAGMAAKMGAAANRGTGGTALLPFLKQCRDETGDPAAGSWGRRILTGGILNLRYTKNAEEKTPTIDELKAKIKSQDLNSDSNAAVNEDRSGHW